MKCHGLGSTIIGINTSTHLECNMTSWSGLCICFKCEVTHFVYKSIVSLIWIF